MIKQYWLYFLILGLALVVIVLLDVFRPVPVDWSDSFSSEEKIPYGTWILFDQLPEIFPGSEPETTDATIYQTLVGRSDSSGVYMLLNADVSVSETDSDQLLEFVERGGNVFIAAEYLEGPLFDSLGVTVSSAMFFQTVQNGDSMRVRFVSPALSTSEPYTFLQGKQPTNYYFALFDEKRSTVLGETLSGDSLADPMVNYLKVDWGKGAFYLSTVPRVFTNLGLLADRGAGYVSTALSYVPVAPVIWDEFYKTGKAAGRHEVQSPLRYVLSQDALRWSYYLLLVGSLLFVFFGARRRQRIIPVIEPPRNTTLEFVETIGGLYHQHGDFRNVADKMILHLLDYIRTHLDLPTVSLDQRFVERVAERSGVESTRVIRLFNLVRTIETQMNISKEDLLQLSEAIEYFYRNTQR